MSRLIVDSQPGTILSLSPLRLTPTAAVASSASQWHRCSVTENKCAAQWLCSARSVTATPISQAAEPTANATRLVMRPPECGRAPGVISTRLIYSYL